MTAEHTPSSPQPAGAYRPPRRPYCAPPHRDFRGHRRGRPRFFRFVVLGAFLVFLALASGAYTLMSLLTTRFGLGVWAIIIPLGLWLVVAVSALGGLRRFAWPLNAVMEAADHVAGGDYTVRVVEHGPPAMRALAHSFNTMTERLQHADRQRRDLMADLAHELRTPLSVLQGRLEGMIDDVYPRDADQLTRLLDETRVLSRLIDDLRTLALSDAGVLPLQRESTDLPTLVADLARSFEADAARGGVALAVEPSPPMALDIDPLRMREVLSNLVANAVRHTPAGGAVTLSIERTTNSVAITVRDTGAGLSADDLARVFDRFYKGPESRGSGLGLTIARSLARAHGGDITATSRPGIGTTMTVTVPV